MYYPGDCIIILTNKDKDGKPKAHLFVIILEATNETDKTILIPLCSIPRKGYFDDTTIFGGGEHDFIKKPTYVKYSVARILSKEKLDHMIQLNTARMRNPRLNISILQEICHGILKSPHIPYEVSSLYEDQLFDKL